MRTRNRSKRKAWSYSAGERGRNRVRAFEHATGLLFVEFYSNGKRIRESLGHRDKERAKRQVELAAAKLGAADGRKAAVQAEDIDLGSLLRLYLREVSLKNSKDHRLYDERAAEMFKSFFGSTRKVRTFGRQDWDRFARDRAKGHVGHGNGPWKPVGSRTVQKDLSFLSGVLNWATVATDGQGGVLLNRNPFKGYKPPREKNPRRPTLDAADYLKLRDISPRMDWRYQVALVLAYETGRRIGSIGKLRWSDFDASSGRLTWRAENDKMGKKRQTPLSEEAIRVLAFARSKNPGVGEAHILPSVQDATKPVQKYYMRDLWHRAERLAGLDRVPGRGWHSCRRRFATDLMDEPLKVVCELGGWSDYKTLLNCYQQPQDEAMRDALARRKRASG